MTVITDIHRTRKGYWALFCEDGFLFSVDGLLLAKRDIREGSRLDERKLEELRSRSEEAKAVDRCVRYLSERAHSRKQLIEKLGRYYDEDVCLSAVDRAREMGLVDDREYRKQRAAYLRDSKQKSLGDIRADLARRGISREIREDVIGRLDTGDEIDIIENLISSKYSSRLDSPEKVISSLMRKGFRYREIRKRLERFDVFED